MPHRKAKGGYKGKMGRKYTPGGKGGKKAAKTRKGKKGSYH